MSLRGNRLPIGSFLIRSKERRIKEEKSMNSAKIQCNRCMAAIRIRPNVYFILVGVWSILGVVVLIAMILCPLTYADYFMLLLILMLAACGSILLSWRFLEATNLEGSEDDPVT